MGGRACARVTRTLRERLTCHPRYHFPAFSDAPGALSLPLSGHPTGSPPSCQLAVQAQLSRDTSFDFLLISLSRLKSGNRGSLLGQGLGDENFNFPEAPWQL